MPDWPSFLSTILASGIGALAAGAVGYRYALAKFRRERTFDRQLVWYEKACSVLLDAARKLSLAIAADRIGLAENEQRTHWSVAIESLLSLRALEIEAEMYASPASYSALSEALRDVLAIANTVPTVTRYREKTGAPSRDQLYEICFKMLNHAASRLATDVRGHLNLEAVARDVRLYDQDFRELQAELEEWKRRGQDFGQDLQVPSLSSASARSPSAKPAV